MLYVEPINLLFRLIFLPFQPENTKLYFNNNKTFYRYYSYAQPFIRWGLGESRQDILHFQLPILIGLQKIYHMNLSLTNWNLVTSYLILGLQHLSNNYTKEDNALSQHLHTLEKKIKLFKESPENISHSYFVGKEEFPKMLLNQWNSTKDIEYLLLNLESLIILNQKGKDSKADKDNYVDDIFQQHLLLIDNFLHFN